MAAPHNPLDLGRPFASSTSGDRASEGPVRNGAGNQMPGSDAAGAMTAVDPGHVSPIVGHAGPPRLLHTRTAPTTVPVNPVAHAPASADASRSLNNLEEHRESDEEGSSAATLRSEHGVSLAAGGLHGRPLPGSRMNEKWNGNLEKDHQAASAGPPGGEKIAERARADLGLTEKEDRDTFDTKAVPGREIERTASGTHVNRRAADHTGRSTAEAFGMVPVSRQMSRPPVVGMLSLIHI